MSEPQERNTSPQRERGTLDTQDRKPGVCTPWPEKREELAPIRGDEEIVRRVWEEVDQLGYLFVWHCLVSF